MYLVQGNLKYFINILYFLSIFISIRLTFCLEYPEFILRTYISHIYE